MTTCTYNPPATSKYYSKFPLFLLMHRQTNLFVFVYDIRSDPLVWIVSGGGSDWIYFFLFFNTVSDLYLLFVWSNLIFAQSLVNSCSYESCIWNVSVQLHIIHKRFNRQYGAIKRIFTPGEQHLAKDYQNRTEK